MIRALFVTAVLVWTTPLVASAERFSLLVEGSGYDRQSTPVSVRIVLPESQGDITRARLTARDGRRLVGQVTAVGLLDAGEAAGAGEVNRELHFVLPSLGANEQATYEVELLRDEGASDEAFHWHDSPDEYRELRFAQQPVLRYMYRPLDESSAEAREQTYKVFHHVYDPTGSRLVTKGAGGLYTHHRGLFYGFNRITYGPEARSADVWHAKGDAHQSHAGELATEAGPVLGRHRVAIDWHGHAKEVFAREERELSAYRVPGGILLEFASRLRSAIGPVRLDGDPQHAGFHFRADNEVADKTEKQTYYLRPTGPDTLGATRNWPNQKDHVDLPWNAMSFVLGDQRYTVGYLDRPSNPKEARFSERAYGRFGSYFEYDLTDDAPLELNYRVWLQSDEMSVEEVARRSQDFVAPPRAEVVE